MRRQVKPFVTEYRGNARRIKDLNSSKNIQQAPRSRSFAEAEKVFQSETPDDSYEAALRAADALFDASPRHVESASGAAHLNALEPEKAFKAAPLRTVPDQAAGEDSAHDATGATAAATVERDEASSPRRILQAIEPPPENRFAALEAERAPKRRGRKPGSKNKPKFLVVDDWGAPRAATSRIASSCATPTAGVAALAPTLPFAESKPHEAVDAVDNTEVEQALPQPRGRNDKFGWKRAGLRPGERWKRRLPKVAW